MKSTCLFPIFFLLLLTAFISHLPSSAKATVFDTDGDQIYNGGAYYYIVPTGRGALGGGVDIAATRNETCPLTISQARFDTQLGRPVNISSLFPFPFIDEGFPVSVSFMDVPSCAPTPSRWTVVEGLPEGGLSLKITGYDNTLRGDFAIYRLTRHSYKLTFCPSSGAPCSGIGVDFDNHGNRPLVLLGSNDPPLSVQFVKVSSSSV